MVLQILERPASVDAKEHLPINIEVLRNALLDPVVYEFEKDTLMESYARHFKRPSDTDTMIHTALDNMRKSQLDKPDIDSLYQAVDTIKQKIFFHNPNFWFNQAYAEYKRKKRVESDFKIIQPYLADCHKVLDFGSGAGTATIELAREGYDVFATDVMDVRIPEAHDHHFSLMSRSDRLPSDIPAVDATLCKSVLHHIDSDYLEKIIQQLCQKTNKTIILNEDTFGFSPEDYPYEYLQQPRLQKFLSLNLEQQLESLALGDTFANVIAGGVRDMALPYNFKKTSEWDRQMNENGFVYFASHLEGFANYRVTQNCQMLRVYKRQ